MGKKDLWQCNYFDDKRRFADLFNGAMFQGKPVMKEEELEEADSKLIHHEKSGEAVSVIRDKVYKWKGRYVSICVLENQSYVDYRMVFRVMLEEAVSYIKQQKRIFKKWKEAGYRFAGDEFLSQMRKEEKFMPVITLILYLGKEKAWDGAKTLYELLDIKEEIDKYKKKTEKGDTVNMCKAWDDHKESGRREGRKEEKVQNLKCIMKNLKVTMQQAMDILEIPEEERSVYVSL